MEREDAIYAWETAVHMIMEEVINAIAVVEAEDAYTAQVWAEFSLLNKKGSPM